MWDTLEKSEQGGKDVHLMGLDVDGNPLWSHTDVGEDTGLDDVGYAVVEIEEGDGYIVAGYTESRGSPGKNALLMKTDREGLRLWSWSYRTGVAHAVLPTPDGYVFVGWEDSAGGRGKDAFAVRTDQFGDELLSWTSDGLADEAAYAVTRIPNGGYAVAGYTESSGAGGSDAYLVILDEDLAQVGEPQPFGGPMDEVAHTIRASPNGGYILGGSTESFGSGGKDVLLFRADAQGMPDWNRSFGGEGDEEGFALIEAANGGYIVAGRTRAPGGDQGNLVYLLMADANGNL